MDLTPNPGAVRRRWMHAVAGYLLLAVVVTWPLAIHLDTHLPQGHELSGTVPLFNLWTLGWNSESFQNGYISYWNAPIFHPDSDALALSEPMLMPGIGYTFLRAMVRRQVAAYNLLLLGALALNGIAVARLSCSLDLPWDVSAATGAMGVALAFVLRELSVLQLVFVFPVIFSFSQLIRFADRPSRPGALWLGFWVGATFLCCGYYFTFLSLFLTLGAAVHIRRDLLRPPSVIHLAYGALLAAVLVVPLASHQLAAVSGFDRPDAQIIGNSARLTDYLELEEHSLGVGVARWLVDGAGGAERLYPGTAMVVLALIGAVIGWRTSRQRWVSTCVVGALLAVLLSLGLNLELWGHQPYRILMAHWPGFGNLRSPYRMALFVQIFALSLAGFPLADLIKRWGRTGRVTVVLIVAIAVFEVVVLPAPLYEFPHQQMEQPWIPWLAAQPEGAVAMVPFAAHHEPWAYQEIVVGMLQGLDHGKPLVNGYSGFLPHRYWSLRNVMLHFPNDQCSHELRAAGVAYLVVDTGWITPSRHAAIVGDGSEVLYQDLNKVIYRFPELRITD